MEDIAELSTGMVRTIRSTAEKARELFGGDEDELLSIADAALKAEVSEESICLWLKRKLIPSEKIGRRRLMRKSVIEKVRELREEHGKGWANFVPWPVDTKPRPTMLSSRRQAEPEELEQEDGDGSEDAAVEVAHSLIKVARKLRDAGKNDAAADVLWAAIEHLGLGADDEAV